MRIAPQLDEKIARFLPAQIVEKNAKALAVGKLGIVAALAGEIGIELEAMADIAHHDEGRPFVRRRQMAGIVLGLLAGIEHEHVPLPAGAPRRWGIGCEKVAVCAFDLLGAALEPRLLGFEHEGAALVEIDAALGRRAVGIAEGDGALEDIVVVLGDGGGGIGR